MIRQRVKTIKRESSEGIPKGNKEMEREINRILLENSEEMEKALKDITRTYEEEVDEIKGKTHYSRHRA